MKLSAEVKQYFKKLGIPVRVHTVAVKNPFVQVWISPTKWDYNKERNAVNPLGSLEYDYEFPVSLRQNLLKVIYGDDFPERQAKVGCSDSSAGNVRAHSLSFSESEWRKLCQKLQLAEILSEIRNNKK